MMTIGSLFSGIGGIELGLERTGRFKTIWNCEIDEWGKAVLKKNWPNILNLGDITKVRWEDVKRPDIICGGFPCQDVSHAGKGIGVREGERSGLWREYAKAIRILRPEFVIAENVSALPYRGLDLVITDIAAIGYDAEWTTISACEVGAYHPRERIFIVAYPKGSRRDILNFQNGDFKKSNSEWLEPTSSGTFEAFGNTYRALPEYLRVPNGIPERLDAVKRRVKTLGNAVVPQVAQVIGERIIEAELIK